jgi:tRNA-splicing ligase RtcB
MDLPVSVSGALMPDAHVGYGLPIGGVLATDNAVVPWAVGVDIACRMRLTIYAAPPQLIESEHQRLCNILQRETLFGAGASFQTPLDHEVMDDDWDISSVVRSVRDKAGRQLGSSGSGNHFAEFGAVTLDGPQLGLEAGAYLGLLTHSGSRGAGATIANHYSDLAMKTHPELPPELRRLAWLDLDSEAGQEYWAAMNLMGRYAAANHEWIHRKVTRALGADVAVSIENHHNFAWLEQHEGRDVVVHRKGATPAADGVLGVIPGSMSAPGFVVRGKGGEGSLDSASHGAGRAMSRTKAKETFRWAQVRPLLEERKVTPLSAGIDEVPGAYKDIHEVMAAQSGLVDTIARFEPRIVKMAGGGERPED